MVRVARGWVVLAVLAALAAGDVGYGQSPEPLVQPILFESPVASPPGSPHGSAVPLHAPGASDHAPPSVHWETHPEPRHGPAPGLFGMTQVDLVGPHIKNRVAGLVNVGGFFQDRVQLPSTELNWTVAPRFEVGYRFPDEWGALVFGYRFLNVVGNETLLNYDESGPGALRSRLDYNVFDLDYRTIPLEITEHGHVTLRLGARIASAYFDSRAVGSFMQQRTSNHFFGSGPHAMLDWRRELHWEGFGLFGRLDAAVPIGRIGQTYEESFTFADGTSISGRSRIGQSQAVPMLGVQAGIDWRPPYAKTLNLSFGYVFERWWLIGETDTSRAGLTTQGVQFRFEWNY